ncbi:hypothetical protein FDC50_08225 [Clostridium botulinum]|nr:hypothetical protein KU41_04100 [Clostridium botulinum]MBY6805156.1 hypothetical protein [Clostridium botulinum]MBY6815173.1 hypothetical protein [Clostridium botulinum]MBY6821799.1 hypothetical protein [Clostridium botulinum]NFJ52304.1 hypothetical protein [Clostridium botulinum]
MFKIAFTFLISLMGFFNTYGHSKQWGRAIYATTILLSFMYIVDYIIIRPVFIFKGVEKEQYKHLSDGLSAVLSLVVWQILDKIGLVEQIMSLGSFN